MDAAILRDFMLGAKPASALARDMTDVWHWDAADVRVLQMRDLTNDFSISPAHLVRLCDAVLEGDLQPADLEAIGFGIIASDHFIWDGDSSEVERVGNTLYDWSCPEVNFALTSDTVRKFRERLLTGEDKFTRDDHYKGPLPAPTSRWAADAVGPTD